jgi:hypothetical protein
MGNRLVTTTLTMAAVLGAGGLAIAQPAAGDSVTGILYVTQEDCFEGPPPFPGEPPFVQCFTPNRYVFDVQSGPAGENPTGSVNFVVGERVGLRIDPGSVTCLSVTQNRATIGVNFRGFAYGPPDRGPSAALIYVEDNGGEGLDRIAVEELPAGSAPISCPQSPPPGVTLQPTFSRRFSDDGSVTVVDARPTPTSKDECKNGGYAWFGFQNQGRCVAFVNEQPKR